MDVLFENHFVRNRQLLKETYSYLVFRRWFVIMADAGLLLLMLESIYCIIAHKPYSAVNFILFPVYMVLQIFAYNNSIKIALKRDFEIHGKEITADVEVTDDFIKNTLSTGSVWTLKYSDIKGAKQTKNYILLFTNAKYIYSFKKDAFTVGTTEEFIAFLKTKGIKVK